ncbi:MAG TPA: ATP-binding protein [Chitinophagaceae bacterium]
MKATKTLLLLALLIGFRSVAQESLPPVYEIKSDTAFEQVLDNVYWQVLEDRTGKLKIEQVTTIPFQNSRDSKIDTTLHTYWLRYRLRNTLSNEINISLATKSDQSDFYLFRGAERPKHFVTGSMYPWNKKDGFKLGNTIPITLAPHEDVLIYYRLFNHNAGLAKDFTIAFVNTEKEMKKEFNEYNSYVYQYFSLQDLQAAFVIGLLVLTIFFNLFFYRVTREKVNLYFALFALFLAINRLWDPLYFLFYFEHPSLSEDVKYLHYCWAFIPLYMILFVRQFFHISAWYKKWDQWLLIFAGINLVLKTIVLIEIYQDTNWRSTVIYKISDVVTGLVFPLNILITFMLFFRKRDFSSRLLIAGASPYFIWLLLAFSFGFEVFPSSFQDFFALNYRLLEVICITALVLTFSWTLFIRYNNLRKENTMRALENERIAKEREIERRQLIEQQKIEMEKTIEERTSELKQSLKDLKETQSQLIQSEKMASLGELTAGIAHEIQNPLNFVNNFSDVNAELIDELQQEAAKGNIEEIKAISKDIKDNEQKINHHGKRADAIVKGMLQHSRTSSGQKEATDINALADEYLRLAYHGLRAKDKSFNATTKTEFDDNIGKVNVVPQDIGRVVLNLINNAFYAVDEKKKQMPPSPKGEQEGTSIIYEPVVTVSTKRLGPPLGDRGKIEIRVADNGNGIPQKVLDKIFQPFFTTKPTGQGTGLGLSLAYDIITKGHGGELKVETKEGDGTEFIIKLPFS